MQQTYRLFLLFFIEVTIPIVIPTNKRSNKTELPGNNAGSYDIKTPRNFLLNYIIS